MLFASRAPRSNRGDKKKSSSVMLAGLLWLLAGSATALNPNFLPTQYLIDVYNREDGFPSDAVWVAREGPRGYLWVGTRGGLVRFDGRNTSIFNKESTPAFLANEVRDLEWTRENALWIGTYGGGVIIMSGSEFRTLTTNDGLSSDVVFDILHASDGSTWIATDNGVSRYIDGVFRNWTRRDGLPSDQILRLTEGDDGTIWFGSLINGVGFFNGEEMQRVPEEFLDDGEIHMLVNDPALGVIAGTEGGSLYSLSADGTVSTVDLDLSITLERSIIDRDGNRWLATYGGGLWRLKQDGAIDEVDLEVDGKVLHVYELMEDSFGGVWVSTPQGLFRLRDSPFRAYGSIEGAQNSIFSVVTDDDGDVWIGTEEGGPYVISADGNRVNQLSDFAQHNVTSLLARSNGEVWLGTFGGGILRLDSERQLIEKVKSISGSHIFATKELRDGSIWVASEVGVERWENGTVEPALKNFSLPIVRHINQARSGTIWLSTNDGLYEVGTSPARRWGKEQGLPGTVITSTYEDERGVLWVTFRNGGLARIVGDQVSSFGPEQGISMVSSFAVLEDSSRNLWISSSDGLLRIARDELDAVALGEKASVRSTRFDERRGLRSSQFHGGFQPAAWKARDNRLWYVSSRGLMGFNPQDLIAESPRISTYIDRVSIDGEQVPLTNPLNLPADFRSLEIEYSAPALRDAYRIDFRYRIGAGEGDWQLVGDRNTAYFNALPAGESTFTVQARVGVSSFPGVDEGGAPLRVNRAPRWYETTWSVLLGLGVLVILMIIAQRFMTKRARIRELKLKQKVDRRTFELREALAQVEANARVDTLTGIPNRKHMEEQLAAVWNMARRSGAPVTILMLDIDRFKEYNDTLGHKAGDDCLRKIARTISDKLLREHDMVARYGGEEFLVVLYDADTAGARGAARRILECVQALQLPHPASDVSGFVSISVGYATATIEQANRPEELIDLADRALYDAKRDGRNRIAAAPGSATIPAFVDIVEASNSTL